MTKKIMASSTREDASQLRENTNSIPEMTFQERIQRAFAKEQARRLDAGEPRLTKTELWKAAGLSSSAVSNWFMGRNAADFDVCVVIANILRVNPYWLFDESRSMDDDISLSAYIQMPSKTVESGASNVEEAPALGSARRVPVVGTAQLGDNGFWADLELPVGAGDGFVEVAVRDGNSYALRCRGDSMKPRIKDGEFVIVEPWQPPSPGDEVLVRAADGRVMVKELLYIRDGAVHLLSVNETHGKISIPLDEVECMHLVSGIVKRALWRPD